MKIPAFKLRKAAKSAESTFAATVALEPVAADSDGDSDIEDIVLDDAPPTDDRPFDDLPTIGHIGRYALKYRLGEGGHGTVYAALDPLLSRPIALKMLHLQVAPEHRAALEANFLQEARAAAGLNHPHIVTVHDAGTSDQALYIAMERLKGADLRQLLQGGWRARPHQAAQIVRRAADALAYAHDKGVVHCDIKPANIFMVGRTHPKVLDFGIARLARSPGQPDTDIAAGSPSYMAPEQLRGEPVDRRSDVYALGAVLYELLCGRRAFGTGSIDDVIHAALNDEPVPVQELNPLVPPTLAAIVQRAMRKNPAQRFRSAGQMVQALRLWMAENPGSPPRPRRSRRGHAGRLRLAVGAAVLGTAGVGVLGWTWHTRMSPPADSAFAAVPSAASPPAALRAGPASVSGARPRSPHELTSAGDAGFPSGSADEVVSAGDPEVPSMTPRLSSAPSLPGGQAGQPVAGAIDVPASLTAPTSTSGVTTTVGLAAVPVASLAKAWTSATPAMAASAMAASASGAPTSARPTATSGSGAASGGKPALAAPKPGARDRKAKAPNSRASSPAPLAPPAMGSLQIAISPWGDIEVDGAPAGTAPPLRELRLSEGTHSVTVRNADFPAYSTSVHISADQPAVLRFRFGS